MFKPYYIGALIFYGLVAMFCWTFMAQGLGGWYSLLAKPSYMPSVRLLTGLRLLGLAVAFFSLILFVNQAKGTRVFGPVLRLYVVYAMLNLAFCYLFFIQHVLGAVVLVEAFAAGSVVMIMALARPYSYRVVLLLFPCFVWGAFSTQLAYDVFLLNN